RVAGVQEGLEVIRKIAIPLPGARSIGAHAYIRDAREDRPIELRAVERRAAQDGELIAAFAQLLDEHGPPLFGEHAMPIGPGDAVEEREHTDAGRVASAEVVLKANRLF